MGSIAVLISKKSFILKPRNSISFVWLGTLEDEERNEFNPWFSASDTFLGEGSKDSPSRGTSKALSDLNVSAFNFPVWGSLFSNYPIENERGVHTNRRY